MNGNGSNYIFAVCELAGPSGDPSCTEPFGTTLGTERTSASERPSSRAFVDFLFSSFLFVILCPPYCLVFDNKRPSKLQHKIKMAHAFQSYSFLLLSFIFPSFLPHALRSRTSLTDKMPTLRGSHMFSFIFSLYAYISCYSYLITGHPRGRHCYTEINSGQLLALTYVRQPR